MAALPIAVFMSLAASCAPAQPAGILAAVAQTESAFDPLALRDNTTGRTYRISDKSEAEAQAARLIADGHSVDLGLMQVNSGNLARLHMSVADAFDPCRSIAGGAAVLGPAYKAALSTYNTGRSASPVGLAYAQRVNAAAVSLASNDTATTGGGAPENPWELYRKSGEAYFVFGN